jgi:hypothetical protein
MRRASGLGSRSAVCCLLPAACCLLLEDDWLRFYIKPVEGLTLPEIMQRLKQVFARRVNQAEGRIGHIRGERSGFANSVRINLGAIRHIVNPFPMIYT